VTSDINPVAYRHWIAGNKRNVKCVLSIQFSKFKINGVIDPFTIYRNDLELLYHVFTKSLKTHLVFPAKAEMQLAFDYSPSLEEYPCS